MSTKNQHFVPRVYQKGWEGTVYSLREPNKPFDGVYIYSKGELSIGDGRTRETVLAQNHTYTIDYDHAFIARLCPEVLQDLSESVYNILIKRNVVGCYEGVDLVSSALIASSFPHIEDWEYFYTPTRNAAPKRAIINEIKNIRSYIIESAFSIYVENHWDSILSDFIEPAEKLQYIGRFQHSYSNPDIVRKIVEMYAYMAFRNPTFDLFGTIPAVNRSILEPLFMQGSEADRLKGAELIDKFARGLWLSEIYKGLYKLKPCAFDNYVLQIINRCGIVLYKVRNEDEGSFLTSDNPAFIYLSAVDSKNNNGLFFPLTSKYLLFIGLNSGGTINDVLIKTVGNSDIKQLNEIIFSAATSSIISCEKYLGYIL